LKAVFLAVFLIGSFAQGTESFEQVKSHFIESDGKLLDRNGMVIDERRLSDSGRALEWATLSSISPALKNSIIVAEDKRFYEHGGVDWRAFAAAAWGSLFRTGKMRGASTITMQVVSLLEENLKGRGLRKNIAQKWKQIRRAKDLEKSWTKDEILEAYLNLVSYRGELRGIKAASRGLFEKDPHGIDALESLVLAALVRSPNASPKKVAERACELARRVLPAPDRCGEISQVTFNSLSRPYFVHPTISIAPFVARMLLPSKNNSVKVVKSTLSGPLQQFATDALGRVLEGLKSQNVHDGAILVLDNASGDVLAYVGNSGKQSSRFYVNGITARRQAGSILKPFIYARAIDKRILTAASMIEDTPLDIPVSGGVYRPRNYDSTFHGAISLRWALASSLNVPAVKTLMLVGIEDTLRIFDLLGIKNLKDGDYYGPSLALGSVDVSLEEVVNAFRTIANGGVQSGIRFTPSALARVSHRVFSKEAAFIISDILSDRESRSLTFGLDNPLATRFWTAAKTGTSKDMRDNWCVGFSMRYSVGVWVGNFSGAPMWSSSGITGAGPLWMEIMGFLHRDLPSTAPRPPQNIIEMQSNKGREYFISGTEPASRLPSSKNVRIAKITYPAPGTIVAMDPDIPPTRQRVFFESEPTEKDMNWVLDGRIVGSAADSLSWPPFRGRHELELVDGTLRVVDSVRFEVR
jgi:penicillin-binding protein 1C